MKYFLLILSILFICGCDNEEEVIKVGDNVKLKDQKIEGVVTEIIKVDVIYRNTTQMEFRFKVKVSDTLEINVNGFQIYKKQKLEK